MAVDPNRWTIKTQEAFAAASDTARTQNHAEITPDHLLAALVAQPEGLAVPLLGRAGVEPTALAKALDERLGSLAKAYGSAQPSMSRRRAASSTTPTRCAGTWATSTSRSSTSSWPWPTGGAARDRCSRALREVRGSHRVTSQNPEEPYQALENYGRDLTELARQGSWIPSSAATRRSAASSRSSPGGPRTTPSSSASRASARRPSSRAWPTGSSKATCRGPAASGSCPRPRVAWSRERSTAGSSRSG